MKKLVLIILTLFFVQSSFAQTDQPWLLKKMSISVSDMPLEEVLKLLEKDLDGVVFAYSSGTFDVKKRVTIEAREMPLNEILHQIFENQRLELAEMRGKIFLKRKKVFSSGKQRTAPVRRKKILKSDVRKTPEVVEKKPELKKQNEGIKAGVKKQSLDLANAEQQTQIPDKERAPDNVSTNVSSTLMEVVEELTSPGRVRPAPVHKPVRPVDKNRVVLAGANQYSHKSLKQPELPPVPIDSSLIRDKPAKKFRVKKDKQKKEKPEREPEEKKIRFYVAPTTSYTTIDSDAAIKIGGRAVWLKNSRFGVGLSGSAIQSAGVNDPVLSNNPYRLAGGYGGLFLEYNVNPSRRIHFSFPVVLALGAMTYVSNGEANVGSITPQGIEDERVLGLIEPGMLLEVNVIKYVKVAFELNYRYTTFSELNYMDTGDIILPGAGLNGFSAGITLKAGLF